MMSVCGDGAVADNSSTGDRRQACTVLNEHEHAKHYFLILLRGRVLIGIRILRFTVSATPTRHAPGA